MSFGFFNLSMYVCGTNQNKKTMKTTQNNPSQITKDAIAHLHGQLQELKQLFGERMDYAQKVVEVAERDYGLVITRSNVYSTIGGYYKKPNTKVIKAIKTAFKEIREEYLALTEILE